MRLLDRYLLRELLIPLSYCLAGFLIFWISFDLFSDIDKFQREKLTASDIAAYYLVKTPELLVTVLPVGFLLALLYAVSSHGRHNELIAMRAAGRGLFRICIPYMAVGVLLSAGLFALNEFVLPDSSAAAREISDRGEAADPEAAAWRHYINIRNARENRIWNIRAYNLETKEMAEPHIDWRLDDGTRKVIIARQASRTNSHWVFHDVEIYRYEPGMDFERADYRPLQTNTLVIPEITETPEQIELQMKFSQISAYDASKRPQLSLDEIQYLRAHLDLSPSDRVLLATQFHARLAQPWTCLVVSFIALPFAAGASSRRNAFVGVASSIFICFLYFILMRFGLALGTGGFIPPWVAAWLPNVLFASAGIGLALKIR